MLGKRLLQSLPKILTLTHNPKPQIKQFKTGHARSIDREKITHPGRDLIHVKFKAVAMASGMVVWNILPCSTCLPLKGRLQSIADK